jgi:glycosyltransferase involved in cell wall biosynthesis
MKICFLGDGQCIHTYNWIQYFAGKNHHIHLISFTGYGFVPVDNVTVHTIKPSFPGNIKFFSHIINVWLGPFINAIKIRRLVRKINPDILHAHYLTDYGFVGYLLHFPVFVITFWGSDILVDPKNSLYCRIRTKPILNSAKLITGDSKAVMDECLKYCNHPEKIKIVLWGVDLSFFHERENVSREKTKITILCTRDFASVYNIDTIINSIPFVKEKHPNVTYVLKNRNLNEVNKFRQLANSLNVTEFIEFVCKIIDPSEFPQFHYNADIFVSVPSSDSGSISLLEAMACGLPVIVSDIPANREWVTDGWNGLIVPVRNHQKLAEAIVYLIENPDLLKLFGKRNAQIIRERADREKHMAYMEELYSQLLEKS